MCVTCGNTLLSTLDALCCSVKDFKNITPALRLALVQKDNEDTASTLSVADKIVGQIIEQYQAGKISESAAIDISSDGLLDSEAQVMVLMLQWLGFALSSLSGHVCMGGCGAAEQKKMLASLIRIESLEAFVVTAFGALILVYRSESYGDLPRLVAEPTFQKSVTSTIRTASCSSGGQLWRNACFSEWKRENLMHIFLKGGECASPPIGSRICWGCAGPALSGLRQICSKCTYAVFCSHECFASDWKSCHKKICKPLRVLRDAPNRGGNEGIERSMEVGIASDYFKWKTRNPQWKPQTIGSTGGPYFEAHKNLLEKMEEMWSEGDSVVVEMPPTFEAPVASDIGTKD